jgi:HD-GYP domain-containing protein (c-di-GMP phosphodiesterase class II)
VRHEHERWDGSGYPDGLKGEEIPLISRIIAAADIYNALSTDRPYRKAFTYAETVRMIGDMKGTDIDPLVADALLRVVEAKQARELGRPAPSPARA